MPRQPNLDSEEYYEILGCERNANESQLKKAYRKLAVKWHPDKNPDNEDATKKFQKISEAYATLSDPQKRKLYDQYGKQGADAADNMPDGAQMPGGFPGGFAGGFPGGGGGGAHHMSNEDAQRLFSSFFGGSDPFGGMGGFGGGPGVRGGMPGMSFSTGGGGMDPISMMMGGMNGGSMGGMGGGMGGMDPISMMMGGMGGMNGGMPNMGAGGMPRRSQTRKRYDVIAPGTVVSLKGLVNASERNGDRGVIKEFNPSSSRYIVNLEDSDQTMSVKGTNILQHVQVRIHDIQKQPELNGKTGTIIAWNSSKERYNIYVVALQKVVSLKAGNVVLDKGTVVRISGIVAKPELNGKWGTINSWIRDTNKYDIQLSAQQVVRLKVENVRV